MNEKAKVILLIFLVLFSISFIAIPRAEARPIYVDWRLATTEKGEFITAFAHLYGVPQVEEEYGLYFCVVELDATKARVPNEGIIEVSVGDYAQPAREVWEITERKVYTYGLNPTFNDKVAEISTAIPIMVDLKITDKGGNQLYADSKTIQMLPINYYAWVLSGTDMRILSLVLATPHADPIQKILSAAARATPWNAILGYQEAEGYSHADVVEIQMRAIYNVIQNLGVTYVNTPATFTSTEAQRIRLPVQTLSDNCGNCIETVLLFDAIFEAVGFNVNIVFITGHVFLAVDVWPDSDMVKPLETTLIGSGTYDEARKVGFEEYEKANGDPLYYEFNVEEVRKAGVIPTPYMDKMPDGSKFYDKLDGVTQKIALASGEIKKVKNAVKESGSMPPEAEALYREAENLFNVGKYGEAERRAAEALEIITKPKTEATIVETTMIKTATADGGTAGTILGVIILLTPVALIALAVLYVRARRRKATTPPAASTLPPTRPSLKYCTECGGAIPLEATFCKYCGAEQGS